MLTITSIVQEKSIIAQVEDEYKDSKKYTLLIDGQGNKPQIFFRGQSKDYGESSNVASLIRNNHTDNEFSHIKQYEEKFGDMFESLGIDTRLQKLIHMQHYGLHTRLLDVTDSILVALYFATCDDIENDGILYCFPNFVVPSTYALKGVVPQETQREGQLDNTSLDILTSLSYMSPDDKQWIFQKSHIFAETISKNADKFLAGELSRVFYLIYETLLGNTQAKTLDDLEQVLIREDYINHCNSNDTEYHKAYKVIKTPYCSLMESPEIHRLLGIMKDSEYATANDPIDFTKLFYECFFVTAQQINPRIIAQHGYFMFQPFLEIASAADVTAMINEQYAPVKIIIPADAKRTIQQELSDKGYSKETLFPDEISLGLEHKKIVNSINNSN